jgi:hypothetical protein
VFWRGATSVDQWDESADTEPAIAITAEPQHGRLAQVGAIKKEAAADWLFAGVIVVTA